MSLDGKTVATVYRFDRFCKCLYLIWQKIREISGEILHKINPWFLDQIELVILIPKGRWSFLGGGEEGPLTSPHSFNPNSSPNGIPRPLTFANWIAVPLGGGHRETQEKNYEFCHFNFRCCTVTGCPYPCYSVILRDTWIFRLKQATNFNTATFYFFRLLGTQSNKSHSGHVIHKHFWWTTLGRRCNFDWSLMDATEKNIFFPFPVSATKLLIFGQTFLRIWFWKSTLNSL